MKLRACPLLLACLVLAVPTVGAASREARYLNFSAKDKNGIYLRNLKLPEVRLFLDEKPVEVSYLGYKNVDTAVAFLLENSPRTAPHPVSMPQWGRVNKLDQIRYQLVADYFDQLVKNGTIMIAEFARETKLLQGFTSDEFLLEDAVRRIQPNSTEMAPENIEIGRAFAFGLERLRRRPEKRKVLVMVTTTVDRVSYRNMEEYQEVLRANDVDLYVVSFAPRFPTGSGITFEEQMNRFFFLNLVQETGGKLYLSGEYAFISEFTDDLKTRLENSYTIGFYVEPDEEPAEHRVRLEARHEKIDVTHRKKIVY
jgi:VWFA-related protein